MLPERPTVIDRLVEHTYRSGDDSAPGPIAGRAIQAERAQATKPSGRKKVAYGLAGLPNPTVSPTRPNQHRETDINVLGPDEGRAFLLTRHEQKILSVVGAVTVAYLTARLLRK